METYKLIVHTIQIWKRINLLYTQYDMETYKQYCTHNTDMETYKLIVHTIQNTYKLIVHTIQIWKRINLLYTQYRYGNKLIVHTIQKRINLLYTQYSINSVHTIRINLTYCTHNTDMEYV